MTIEDLQKALEAKAKTLFELNKIRDRTEALYCDATCPDKNFCDPKNTENCIRSHQKFVSLDDAKIVFSVFVGEQQAKEAVLRELFKNRPSHKWMVNNLHKIEDVESWFEKAERVFGSVAPEDYVVVPRAEYEGLKETCKILSDNNARLFDVSSL